MKKVAGTTVAAACVAVIGITVVPAHEAAQARTTVLRVPYEAEWELYDNGFAGGPGAVVRHAPAAPEVGLAATERYDGGWAGGPPPNVETRQATTLVRVPYEAAWELYDNGFAGGPNTVR